MNKTNEAALSLSKEQVIGLLAEHGISATYGGKKGHGFWLSLGKRNDIDEDGIVGLLSDNRLNRHWWAFYDAALYAIWLREIGHSGVYDVQVNNIYHNENMRDVMRIRIGAGCTNLLVTVTALVNDKWSGSGAKVEYIHKLTGSHGSAMSKPYLG